MAALVVVKNGIIEGKCQSRVKSTYKGAVIDRAELMSIILKRGIDSCMKQQLSYIYDLILDLETENKVYIKRIKVSNDSEKNILDFIKKEMDE